MVAKLMSIEACIEQLEKNLKSLTNPQSPWYYEKSPLKERISLHDLEKTFGLILDELDAMREYGEELEPNEQIKISKYAFPSLPRSYIISRDEGDHYSIYLLTQSKRADNTKDPKLAKKSSGTEKDVKWNFCISESNGPTEVVKLSFKDDIMVFEERIIDQETGEEISHTFPMPHNHDNKQYADEYVEGFNKELFQMKKKDPHNTPFFHHAHYNKERGAVVFKASKIERAAKHGDLEKFLSQHKQSWPSMEIINQLAMDLLTQIRDFHTTEFNIDGEKNFYCHLDLKPANCLVHEKAPGQFSLEITDFATAKPVGSSCEEKGTTAHYANPDVYEMEKNETSAQHAYYFIDNPQKTLGKEFYKHLWEISVHANPSIVRQSDDMWSVGIILIELYTGLSAFHDREKLWNLIQSDQDPNWKNTPESVKKILRTGLLNPSTFVRDEWTAQKTLDEFLKDLHKKEHKTPRPRKGLSG